MTVLDVDRVVAVTWNKKLKRIEFLVKERQTENFAWVDHQSLPDHVIPLKFKQIVFDWTQRLHELVNEDSNSEQEEEDDAVEEDLEGEDEEEPEEDDEEDVDDSLEEEKNNQQFEVKSEERVSINHEDLSGNFPANITGINPSS